MPFFRPRISQIACLLIPLALSIFILALLFSIIPAQAFPESTMYAVEMTDELQKAHEYIDKSEYGKSIEIYKRVLFLKIKDQAGLTLNNALSSRVLKAAK
jgi:hypothetical protein